MNFYYFNLNKNYQMLNLMPLKADYNKRKIKKNKIYLLREK